MAVEARSHGKRTSLLAIPSWLLHGRRVRVVSAVGYELHDAEEGDHGNGENLRGSPDALSHGFLPVA
ncbi:MAG TPA: hypothetical protein VM580_06165 [Labilithrix sp.]|nr:hypothetical protein [Labilithrix sp.]